MTINYNFKDVPCRSRLPFGVPIEDIFPSDDIHPHLKATFIRAYHDISSSGKSISDILSKFQGSVEQRLEAKKAVSECNQMPHVTPPGVILWVIRHFIGLLPIPLLPTYTDEKYFSWYHLAGYCKKVFLQHRIVDVNNALLTAKIAKDLLRLPPSSLLLFAIIVQFIRSIASNKYTRNRLNRLTAYYLVRYFCSSLFLRPYTPGSVSKLDRQYFPLLLYIVLRWKDIENLFKQKTKIVTSPELEIPQELLNSKRLYSLITTRYADIGTQTDLQWNLFDSISVDFFETNNYLKDVGVQTVRVRELDLDQSSIFSDELSLSKLCGTQSSLSLKSFDELFANVNEQDISTPREIGCNTEYSFPINLKFNDGIKVDHATNTDYFVRYKSSDEEEKRDIQTPEGEYIDDSYEASLLNLITPKQVERKNEQQKLVKRVSKIGWTYTPPKSNTLINLKDNKSNLNNYTLCYGSKELLAVEIKESASPKNDKSEEEADHSVKRKRSNFSVASIKSKLDFLKKFTPRKNKLKGSNSLEDVTNIKYKKMNSKKSTTF